MTRLWSFASACAFGAALAFVVAPGHLQSQEAPPANGEQKSPWVEGTDSRPAEQAYMNIKVFTGLPANRLEFIMKTWKDSLGVQCTFCHIKGEWERDDKEEKETARHMKTMTEGIAKSYFNGKYDVTCYTCHHGEAKPAKNPPAAPVKRQPRPVQPGAGL
ncbi:MAG: c-type cytochrome [Bryobacterales bacterium]|nr:c-type cytochrome [Bryobacterales bacterium]